MEANQMNKTTPDEIYHGNTYEEYEANQDMPDDFDPLEPDMEAHGW